MANIDDSFRLVVDIRVKLDLVHSRLDLACLENLLDILDAMVRYTDGLGQPFSLQGFQLSPCFLLRWRSFREELLRSMKEI